MLNIRKTTDYSQFKFFASNRPTHPKKLIESIQKKNLLSSHPILCTEDLHVVDGQNRLKAAEALGVPIYYIVESDLGEDDISTCQVQNTWKLPDFLKYYSGHMSEYEFIEEIMKMYPFQIHFVVQHCSSQPEPFSTFKNGSYTVKKDKYKLRKNFQYIADILNMIKKLEIPVKISANAYRALWSFVNMREYDHEHMLKKIDKLKDKVIVVFGFKEKHTILDSLINKVFQYKDRLKIKKDHEDDEE